MSTTQQKLGAIAIHERIARVCRKHGIDDKAKQADDAAQRVRKSLPGNLRDMEVSFEDMQAQSLANYKAMA